MPCDDRCFFEQYKKARGVYLEWVHELRKEMDERSQGRGGSPSGFIEKDKKEQEEHGLEDYHAQSVAHHILDWYIQLDPKGFHRIGNPRKVVAYIMFVVQDYNVTATDSDIYLGYDNKLLAEFGGWKGAGGLSDARYKIMYPLLERVGAPELLFIDGGKVVQKYQYNPRGTLRDIED